MKILLSVSGLMQQVEGGGWPSWAVLGLIVGLLLMVLGVGAGLWWLRRSGAGRVSGAIPSGDPTEISPAARQEREWAGSPTTDSALTGAVLVSVDGTFRVPLHPLPFRIGRGAANQLVVGTESADDCVGEHQATIAEMTIRGRRVLVVEDMGDEGCGIRINGLPTPKNVLREGMNLKIGRTTFVFRTGAAAQ